MILNTETKIIGKNVMLVPYRKLHVPKYHEWMKSVELQELTASEPLTLESEFEMQESWRNDSDKCTFIILDRRKYEETNSEIDSMIGDTNIFITPEEDTENVGEVEIMIAEKHARGQKMGWESMIMMLLYAIQSIKLTEFVSKISLSNSASLKMFEKLGFKESFRSEILQEVTLRKKLDDPWFCFLKNNCEFNVCVHPL